jgi:archaellum biogenesis ATPase FlaH
MGKLVAKVACRSCQKSGRDKSKDNFALYDDGSGFCFSCGYTVRSKDFKEEEPEITFEGGALITPKELEVFKENSTYEGKGFRGIRDDTYRTFSVRHQYNEEGRVIAQYYPCTTGYTLTGYKCRIPPKDFSKPLKLVEDGIGNKCDLFGQINFRKASSKYLLVTNGEIGQLSAYQMLYDDIKRRGKDHGPVAVVASVVGEKGCWKQLQAQYNWVNRFDRIVLMFDPDEAGKEATELAIKVLPKGKVYIVDMNREIKDPNDYLMQGKEQEFVQAFYSAKAYTPVGVVGSDTLYKGILEKALAPVIPLPPFMKKLNDKTGGLPLGKIVNIGAASGSGKTSYTNEMVYFWVFNSPYKIGVVSMELDKEEYGEVILSRHLGRKIALINNPDAKHKYLSSEVVATAAKELFENKEGGSRWYLVDDRDGSLKALQATVEELVISCDCRVIILDPLQDLLDGLSNEDQSIFMKWQKSLKKSHNVTFININHVRKSGAGENANSAGAFITEEDFAGSSTIFKSADLNILLMRNKYADDPIVRNTTHAVISKCRWTGFTGPAGDYYYDNETHTLWDKDEWMEKHKADF